MDTKNEGLMSSTSASRRPRDGSRTVKNTMTPTTRPGTPSAMNAARQLKACATAPAILAPSHAPIGAPSASTVIAMGRRSGGKQSETMAVDGGVPPASPTPTPMRPSRNSK